MEAPKVHEGAYQQRRCLKARNKRGELEVIHVKALIAGSRSCCCSRPEQANLPVWHSEDRMTQKSPVHETRGYKMFQVVQSFMMPPRRLRPVVHVEDILDRSLKELGTLIC